MLNYRLAKRSTPQPLHSPGADRYWASCSLPSPPGVAVRSSHAGANTEALLGLETSLQEQQRARAKARLPPHPGADHEQMPREGEDFVFPAVLTLPEFGWLTESRLSTIGNKTQSRGKGITLTTWPYCLMFAGSWWKNQKQRQKDFFLPHCFQGASRTHASSRSKTQLLHHDCLEDNFSFNRAAEGRSQALKIRTARAAWIRPRQLQQQPAHPSPRLHRLSSTLCPAAIGHKNPPLLRSSRTLSAGQVLFSFLLFFLLQSAAIFSCPFLWLRRALPALPWCTQLFSSQLSPPEAAVFPSLRLGLTQRLWSDPCHESLLKHFCCLLEVETTQEQRGIFSAVACLATRIIIGACWWQRTYWWALASFFGDGAWSCWDKHQIWTGISEDQARLHKAHESCRANRDLTLIFRSRFDACGCRAINTILVLFMKK